MILAGIVLFNPDLERLLENVNHVRYQVDKLLLIDNGSNNINEIKKIFPNIEIIFNEKNLGIGKALKQIMDYAIHNKYDWVITLDQDSVISNNLIDEYKKYTSISKVGIITCNIIDRNFKEKFESFNNKDYIEIKRCITSASFMSVEYYKNIEGYNEDLFIDMVDWDICAQFIKAGYKIIRINYDGLLHEVGKGKNIRFLWMTWISFNHSPFREYYVTRNRFYLCFKYPEQYSFIKEFFRELKTWIIIVLYESEKKEKIKAKIKGLKDIKKVYSKEKI